MWLYCFKIRNRLVSWRHTTTHSLPTSKQRYSFCCRSSSFNWLVSTVFQRQVCCIYEGIHPEIYQAKSKRQYQTLDLWSCHCLDNRVVRKFPIRENLECFSCLRSSAKRLFRFQQASPASQRYLLLLHFLPDLDSTIWIGDKERSN